MEDLMVSAAFNSQKAREKAKKDKAAREAKEAREKAKKEADRKSAEQKVKYGGHGFI